MRPNPPRQSARRPLAGHPPAALQRRSAHPPAVQAATHHRPRHTLCAALGAVTALALMLGPAPLRAQWGGLSDGGEAGAQRADGPFVEAPPPAATASGAMREGASAASARPRIGLALSGGGARGAAHIGVLKVLESMQIPIDCITGTSMGAIVGGAYASGVSPQDLESAVVETDWDDVFNDRPPRTEQTMRRKQDATRGLSDLELGVRDGNIAIAGGLVSGVQIESFLRRLTRPVSAVEDFSRLPVPFRAVATDIETGEAVVLEGGNLVRALRASMAIPGLIAPVELDGRLLVDGGLADNLPIALARQSCADVVIAVNIQSPLFTREQLGSALSITGQLINLLGKSSVDAQLATLGEHDILITPNLGDITSADFDRQSEAIAIGEAAALEMAPALARLSASLGDYLAHRAARPATHGSLGTVDELRFEGLQRVNPAMLGDRMRTRPGEPLSEAVLAADMRRLYGTGDFEGIDYRIERDPDGLRRLVVTPLEKRWGPDYLGFGVGLASDFSGESQYSLTAQLRRSWLNRRGAEWTTSAQLGWRNRLATELYLPLDEHDRYFVQPHASLANRKTSFSVDERRIAIYRLSEAIVGVDLGRNFGTYGVLQGGPVWRRGKLTLDTGSPFLPDDRSRMLGLRAEFVIDQLDRPWFATDGYRVEVNALRGRSSGDARGYFSRVEAEAVIARSLGPHVLSLGVSAGSDFDTAAPAQALFVLGGPLRLSAYDLDTFQGTRYALLRLDYRNRAVRLPSVLGSGVYLGGALEVGEMRGLLGSTDRSGRRHSASVYLAADTAFGPAYLGLGVGDGGRTTLFLVLGTP